MEKKDLVKVNGDGGKCHLEGEPKISGEKSPFKAHTQDKTQRKLENSVSQKITRVSLLKAQCNTLFITIIVM